jgi:hypothetical protein
MASVPMTTAARTKLRRIMMILSRTQNEELKDSVLRSWSFVLGPSFLVQAALSAAC